MASARHDERSKAIATFNGKALSIAAFQALQVGRIEARFVGKLLNRDALTGTKTSNVPSYDFRRLHL